MSPYLGLAIAVVLPTAAGYAMIGAFRGLGYLGRVRLRRLPAAPPEPIERLTASLRRLRAELERTETTPAMAAKHHHVRALRGAYLDALRAACRQLEVAEPPGGDRAAQAAIYRTEAALRQRGVDVREPAAH